MVEWYWLVVAFLFGIGFGQEERFDRKKKKQKSENE